MSSPQNIYTKAYFQNEDALDAAQARLDKIANDALGPPSTSYSPKRELEYHPMNLFRKWSADREFSNLLDEKNRLLSGNVHGPMFEGYWKTITQNPDAYGYRTDQDVSGLGESRLRNLPEAVSKYPLEPTQDPIYQHHQDNLSTGQYVLNDDDTVSTVHTRIVNDPRFPGEYTLIPSIWDGNKLSEEDAIERAVASGGTWTSSDNKEELQEHDDGLHEWMDPPIPYSPRQSELPYTLSDDRLNQLWHERAYTGAALPNVVPGIDPTIPTDVDSPWYMPTGMDLWDAIILAGGLGRKKVLPFLAKNPSVLLPFVASGHNEGREVDPETGRYVNTYPWDD